MNQDIFVSKIQSCLDKMDSHKRTRLMIDTSFSYLPWFEGEKSDLKIYQKDFVGFYFLRAALRGVLSSVNYLASSEMMVKTELFAPAIQAQYTTCFHTLDSYLALSGILIVNPAKIIPESNNGSDIKAAKIRLTKKGEWNVEPYSRSHTIKWLELKHTFSRKETVKKYFISLFRYFFSEKFMHHDLPSDGLKKQNSNNDQNKSPQTKFFDNIDEFLKRIAKIRHLALYQSFASDQQIYEALVNRDEFNTDLLNKKVINFHRFTISFLDDTLLKLIQLINELDIYKDPRIALYLAAYTPFLDSPKVKSIQHSAIKKKLQLIKDWLNDYSYRKINLA